MSGNEDGTNGQNVRMEQDRVDSNGCTAQATRHTVEASSGVSIRRVSRYAGSATAEKKGSPGADEPSRLQ